MFNEEILICGEEHSVVARFGQHEGHVMTTIYQKSPPRQDICFGDFKVLEQRDNFNKVPDIAVLHGSELLFVGEAKTPWVHQPERLANTNSGQFRVLLGTCKNKK